MTRPREILEGLAAMTMLGAGLAAGAGAGAGAGVAVGLAVGLAVGAGPAMAAEPAADAELADLDAKLPGELVNDPRALLGLVQNQAGAQAKVVRSGEIPGGGAALQVRVANAGDASWKVGAGVTLDRAIARGDIVTVGFYARALPGRDGTAAGRLSVRVQQNESPWPGFLDKAIDIGPGWQWYEASAPATAPMKPGASSLLLMMGDRAQTLEIGQVIVVKGANAIAGAAKPTVPLPQPLQGVAGHLINRPEAGPWNFYGTGGSQQRVVDKGVYLGEASRVTVTDAASKPWELASAIPLEEPIAEGDHLLVAVAVRTVSAQTADGKGTVGLRFQSTQEPWPGFADNAIHPAGQWQLLQLRTTATMALPQGQGAFTLMFGGTAQVVDIGPVYVMKLD